jgi:uncharacterized UPF0160 family protein
MIIKMTQDISEANLVTHNGTFHADEVMATVILGKLLEKITVCRVERVPRNLGRNVIVYDIGGGEFDHHQKGGNGVRKNEVPYAACGLIWKKYGSKLVTNTPDTYGIFLGMDRRIFQGIDAVDNGTMPKLDYTAYSYGISQIIAAFNPTWDSEENQDEAFVKAVLFAETIFDNEFQQLIAKDKAREIIEMKIESSNGHIMILEKYVPWERALLRSWNEKAQEIWFVVYPSNRGGYAWYCVRKELGSKEARKSTPIEWWGLEGKELQRVSGVPTAMFCHKDGFIGAAETLEDAIKMVQKAIDS